MWIVTAILNISIIDYFCHCRKNAGIALVQQFRVIKDQHKDPCLPLWSSNVKFPKTIVTLWDRQVTHAVTKCSGLVSGYPAPEAKWLELQFWVCHLHVLCAEVDYLNTLCLLADLWYYLSLPLLAKIIFKTMWDPGEGAGKQVLPFAIGGSTN